MATSKSWCDKLASVPTVGFRLLPHYASGDAIIDGLSPILNRMADIVKPSFQVVQQTSFDFQFQVDNGFHYAIEPTKAVVSFRHRMKAKPTSGGPPIMEMMSSPLPYTTLLQEATRRVIEVAPLLPGRKGGRVLQRVGIMSITTVDKEEAPPGIVRFIEYVGRPWNTSPEFFEITVASDLGGTGKGWKDRCIHTLKKSEEAESLLTIQLDWQREYEAEKALTEDALKPLLANCSADALKYFEDVAEGSRFDEELISETAGV